MARVRGHPEGACNGGREGDTRERWGSWQWSEGTTGRWKSLPHGQGHPWEWHTLVPE